MSDAINQKFKQSRRRQEQNRRHQQFTHRCDVPQCTGASFYSGGELWTHYTHKHSDRIPGNTEAFRVDKLKECEISNQPLNFNKTQVQWEPAKAPGRKSETSDHRPREISSPTAGNVIQKTSALTLETHKNESETAYQALSPKPKDGDSQTRSPSARRQRAPPPKSTRQIGTRNRIKQEALDPEFEPVQRPHGRLFNADRDNVKTFNPQPQQQTEEVVRRDNRNNRSRDVVKENKSVQIKQEHPAIVVARRENTATGEPVMSQPPRRPTPPFETEDRIRMVRQPETRPISPEQLIAEVKGIYAGLIMVEAKCCEVDNKQHQAALEMDGGRQPKLNNEQWQALIALHRTLLHEHHDFFLASQHPSASPSLKRLASKYAMPARMWRHGIHSFLELLRHRLPHSLEHMLTFIYLAYSMMALLYETVPAFEDTWIECLGDLGRYRMAIEDDDIRDREVWQNVARFWYQKAADKTPDVGRLYHHLAILARPNILSQLFNYCKSLGVSQPFNSARESILTVFDPICHPDVLSARSQPVEAAFVQLHSITFTHVDGEKFDEALDDFLVLLDKHIGRPASKWKVQGCFVAICNITALYQYGARDSLLRRAYKEGRKQAVGEEEDSTMNKNMDKATAPLTENEAAIEGLLPPYGNSAEHANDLEKKYDPNVKHEPIGDTNDAVAQSMQEISLMYSKRLGFGVLSLTLERLGDGNVMPHWHSWLAFIFHLTVAVPALRLLENEFPWHSMVDMLNDLLKTLDSDAESNIIAKEFPRPSKGIGRPLPEDYTLRGLAWCARYFPEGWFEDAQVDNEERSLELPSMANLRMERILWLAMRICASGDWIRFGGEPRCFEVHPNLESRIEEAKRRDALAAKKMSTMSMGTDDEDFEMGAAVCSNSEDEDYVLVLPEVRRLKEQKKRLEAQLQAASGAVVASDRVADSKSTIVKGQDAVKWGYTTFIVDTNLLVSHLETYNLITNKGWSVVIPNCVITELHGLGNNSGPVGDSAKSAMIAINKAITEKKDVKIITAKGNDLTKVGFFREKLERDEEDIRNIDDVIIRTTKLQAELRSQTLPPAGNAESAILLTEDTNMRVKANARGVPAISTTVLKRHLVKMTAGNPPSPRSKRKSPAAFMPKIKQEDDPDTPMTDIVDIKDKDAPPGVKKRGYKQRKTEIA
ncbi:hypothetical protein EDC01DRAFT_635571 [Geopyxis carbonaria]|nr:hypothetical protein EDC01DRAFT_635571 [Geopyxis carbonaria]